MKLERSVGNRKSRCNLDYSAIYLLSLKDIDLYMVFYLSFVSVDGNISSIAISLYYFSRNYVLINGKTVFVRVSYG